MMRFLSLASGSSGNATLVESYDGLRHTRLLIDCGLTLRQLDVRMARAGRSLECIDAIFITHEHRDHVGCAPALAQRLRLPVWLSVGTQEALSEQLLSCMPQIAVDEQRIDIGGIEITPFTVPHDAREPLQLVCTDGVRRLGLLTDLGYVTAHAMAHVSTCHALMMESNHCLNLLARSSYPPFLRRRISGRHGHLNNQQAAEALRELAHSNLSIVVGAHLSEQNNRPELVRTSFAQALNCNAEDVLVSSRDGLDWLTV